MKAELQKVYEMKHSSGEVGGRIEMITGFNQPVGRYSCGRYVEERDKLEEKEEEILRGAIFVDQEAWGHSTYILFR